MRAGVYPHPVNLSRMLVEELCGHRRVVGDDGRRRRAAVLAVEDLERLGVLALHSDYSTGRHGRRYTVWYRFGSGQLPEQTSEVLVVGRRLVAEGELVAVVWEPGDQPVGRLRHLRDGVTLSDATDSWWRRMYARRAFTPAEFFDAEERRVLPGPFRDRVAKSMRQEASTTDSIALSPAPTPIPPSGNAVSFAHHAKQCVCALCCTSIERTELNSLVAVPPPSPRRRSIDLVPTVSSHSGSVQPSGIPPDIKVVPPLREALERLWAAWARSRVCPATTRAGPLADVPNRLSPSDVVISALRHKRSLPP
jgi:hypothetical protein